MLLSVYMSAKYSILSPKKHSLTAVIYPATHSGSTQLEFWMRSRTYSGIFAFPHFCQFLQAKWQGEYISGPQICSHLSYISLASGVAELSPQISSTFTQTAIDSLKFLSHAHRHRHTHTHRYPWGPVQWIALPRISLFPYSAVSQSYFPLFSLGRCSVPRTEGSFGMMFSL